MFSCGESCETSSYYRNRKKNTLQRKKLSGGRAAGADLPRSPLLLSSDHLCLAEKKTNLCALYLASNARSCLLAIHTLNKRSSECVCHTIVVLLRTVCIRQNTRLVVAIDIHTQTEQCGAMEYIFSDDVWKLI